MPPQIRRGIYAILDLDRIAPILAETGVNEREALLAYARAAAETGAMALQLRAKSSPATSLFLSRLYGDLVKACGERLPILMNDHPAAALPFVTSDGVGAHLGQSDASPVTARHQLGDDAVIGLSTHTLAQVMAAGALPVDYIGFGPVRATHTKPGAEKPVGLGGLAAACAAASVPVVAIGGLTLGDIAAVREAGAHAMAVVTAWLGPADDPWSPDQASVAMSMLRATWLASAPAPTPATPNEPASGEASE